MKNATKRRKQAMREATSNVAFNIKLAKIQQELDEENMKEMDRMADALGIESCSDYVYRKMEVDRRNGLCACHRNN